MQIKIVFDTNYELLIHICENDFSLRWLELLKLEIQKNNILQIDTYSSLMPEHIARNYLLKAIDSVNNYLKKEFILAPTEQEYSSKEYYNYLHTRFEKLAGPDWSQPTRLMQVAPDNIKLSIKHINCTE